MSTQPVLLPTSAEAAQYAGYTYHLDGELVPVLTVDLGPGQTIYFEHYILLWKSPSVQISIMPLKGSLKRAVAGIQIFVTQATGPGQIAFSRDGAGHIVPIHLEPERRIQVREHQFLAATQNVQYEFERIKGFSNMLVGGSGLFIDKFHDTRGEGILWLHGYGNVFELTLHQGEQIDVEPGGWLYKDSTVQMETNMQRLSTGLLGSMNMVTNRFTGPGRLGIQSMYVHMPEGK